MKTNNLAEVFSETELTFMKQLDEHQYRLFCASRAISLGTHGVAAVCAAISISKNTVYRGIHELKANVMPPKGRVRVPGGGRKSTLDKHPELLAMFDDIVQNNTAGLPQDDTVTWLDLTAKQIQQKFKEHEISLYIVRKMIKLRGFKKRSFHKTKT